MTVVSRNLQTLKEQRDTTQSAIAAVAGASDGAVSKWFSGEKMPRMKYLEAISAYYNVSVDDLTGERNGLYAKAHGLTDAPAGASHVELRKAGRVPVRVLGAAHAGELEEPHSFFGEAVLYDEIAARHPRCFALEVRGRCMDMLFTPSDHIFVDPDMEARDGCIAVASVDGETVVRRLKRGNGSVMLVAESTEPQNHPDIIIRDGEADVRVVGVVFWWQARSELS